MLSKHRMLLCVVAVFCTIIFLYVFTGLLQTHTKTIENGRLSYFKQVQSASTYTISPLVKAQREEEIRRLIAIESLIALSDAVKVDYKNYISKQGTLELLIKKLITAFEEDLHNIKMIEKEAYADGVPSNYALRSFVGGNFRIYPRIIEQALEMIKMHPELFDTMLTEPVEHYLKLPLNVVTTLLENQEAMQLRQTDVGTPVPNFVQIVLLRTLSILRDNASFLSITQSMPEVDGVHLYDPQTSPIVQSTQLPKDFIPPESFKQWFFYYKDAKSPPQGELLLLNFSGYTFGGSRSDARYKNKVLKNQDCSSLIANNILAKEEFATLHILAMNKVPDNFGPDDMKVVRMVAKHLDKNTLSIAHVQPGDVYVSQDPFGSRHTGYVVNLIVEKERIVGFRSLSFVCSRMNIPNVEGLGYNDIFFTEEKTSDDGTLEYKTQKDQVLVFYRPILTRSWLQWFKELWG